MQILLSWLRDFVEISEPPGEVAEALTMAGMAVDTVTEQDGETVFELDITANRPDALNHIGIAREIGAIYRRPLRLPATDVPEGDPPAAERASIEIADPELCPRYAARVALGVEVKPAPDWMRRRLELCDIRSINNLADLTNYILLELGHPTHAFDLDLLEDSRIIVRRGGAGESLRTIDGVDRTLSSDHLVIADAGRPVALAGVMGGLETEISDSTRNVLFESAWFQPGSIRRTSRHFGMHTEASHRFERGADIEAPIRAADRIAHLLGQVSPGTILRGVLDAYPNAVSRPQIKLRRSSIPRLLGTEIPDREVEGILAALGVTILVQEWGWQLEPPSHRLDLEREIDALEEIARVYGYDRFPSRLPETANGVTRAPFAEEEARLRSIARSLGYHETVSYSFISSEDAKRYGAWDPVRLKNPISEQWDVMRNTAVPSMLKALEYNLNRNEPSPRLVEIGRLYRKADDSYAEPSVLTLGATGGAHPAALGEDSKPLHFFEIKADVGALVEPFDFEALSFDTQGVPSYYAQGRSARVVADGNVLGYLGEIDPLLARERKIRAPVCVAELFLGRMKEVGLRRLHHRTLPRVPAVDRDFSLLVPEGISFAEICAAIGQQAHLVRLEPAELFRGSQVPAGHYSLLLRASWQKPTESLTDEQVNAYASQIVARLSKKLGIEQRA